MRGFAAHGERQSRPAKSACGVAIAGQGIGARIGVFELAGDILKPIALRRLRGALRRAAEALGVEELEDEQAASAFTSLGAAVRRVPTFFAKHPFRVVVHEELAERARLFVQEAKEAG